MLDLFEYDSRQLRRERKKEREREREREREQEMERKKKKKAVHIATPVARGWAGVTFEVITLSL